MKGRDTKTSEYVAVLLLTITLAPLVGLSLGVAWRALLWAAGV